MAYAIVRGFDADGHELADGEIIPDGGRIVVPQEFMDSAPAPEPREAAWHRYCDRLTNAHKRTKSLTVADAASGGDPLTPPTVREEFSGVCPSCGYRASSSEAAPSASQAAYAKYVARLNRGA